VDPFSVDKNKRIRAFAQKYGIKKYDYATVKNPFAGRVICGHCGSPFGRKVWNSTDERLRRVVWRCNNKYKVKGKKSCDNKHINDGVLYQAFINTFNALVENKGYFLEKWQQMKDGEDCLLKHRAQQFNNIIKDAGPIEEFDMDLYFSMVEKMTVYEGKRVIVGMLDGTEVEFLPS